MGLGQAGIRTFDHPEMGCQSLPVVLDYLGICCFLSRPQRSNRIGDRDLGNQA